MSSSIEMFDTIAAEYDMFKRHRDYDREAAYVIELMEQSALNARDARILDLGMATGSLLLSLSEHVGSIAGLDASEHMRKIASHKLGPQAEIYDASFESYKLGVQFDVILWMDGGVGYVHPDLLDNSLMSASKHLNPGGILIIEPWYDRDNWEHGKIFTVSSSSGNRKYTRKSIGEPDGTVLFEHLVYENGELVDTSQGKSHFYLHYQQDVLSEIENAGFEVIKVESPIFKRGLIVAQLRESN